MCFFEQVLLNTAALIYFQAAIDEHEENPSEDDPRDFIDVYLAELKKQEKVNADESTFHSMA